MPSLAKPLVALAFAREVKLLRTGQEIVEALDHRIAVPFGLRAYAVWRVPFNDDVPNSYIFGRNLFPHRSVPDAFWSEWVALYAKNGTSLMARRARLNLGSFTWAESLREIRPTGQNRYFHDLSLKHGLRDGFVSPQGDIIVVLWSKKTIRLDADARDIVDFAARCAASNLRRIMARRWKREQPKLSAMERATLSHYSLGLQPAEIAQMLSSEARTISVKTVHSYLDRARVKLKAKSRPHAVRLAIKAGLICVGAVVGRLLGEPWWIG